MSAGAQPAPTPAVAAVIASNVEHQLLQYSVDGPVTGVAAAQSLGLNPAAVFKTLVVKLNSGEFVVAVVPVAALLDLKKLARAAGSKKAVLASIDEAERLTGYVVGGVSPIVQRKRLPTFVDESGHDLKLMYVSAGRRGLELGIAPADLARLTGATFVDLTT